MVERLLMVSSTLLQINGFTQMFGHGMILEMGELKFLSDPSSTILA